MKNITKIIGLLFIVALGACGSSKNKAGAAELITRSGQQDSLFKNLLLVVNNTIPEIARNDSLSFLLLPVNASCPYCRGKTIDSIVKYKDRLNNRHFIIISANAGIKNIGGFFKERNEELPIVPDKIFLDSTNEASKIDLVDDKPTMYYAYNRKVYKKIESIPASVKDDLHHFFSGK